MNQNFIIINARHNRSFRACTQAAINALTQGVVPSEVSAHIASAIADESASTAFMAVLEEIVSASADADDCIGRIDDALLEKQVNSPLVRIKGLLHFLSTCKSDVGKKTIAEAAQEWPAFAASSRRKSISPEDVSTTLFLVRKHLWSDPENEGAFLSTLVSSKEVQKMIELYSQMQTGFEVQI